MVKLIEITDSFIQIVNDVVVMSCLGKGTLEAHFPPFLIPWQIMEKVNVMQYL